MVLFLPLACLVSGRPPSGAVSQPGEGRRGVGIVFSTALTGSGFLAGFPPVVFAQYLACWSRGQGRSPPEKMRKGAPILEDGKHYGASKMMVRGAPRICTHQKRAN